MAFDIVVPPLSQTADTLILTAWLKQPGDPVTKGEALFEVETDKAVLTVEAPASGVLQSVSAAPGTEVAIKSVIGTIVTAAEPAEVSAAPRPNGRAQRVFASPRARGLAAQAGVALEAIGRATGPDGLIVERDVRAYLAEVRAAPAPAEAAAQPAATPVARRMAQAAGLDLNTLAAAPGSVIKRADVAAALQQQASAPPAAAPASALGSTRVPLSATRLTIARRLQAAAETTVPVTLTRDTDATELVALRERLLLDLPGDALRPTYTDFLLSMLARCLPRHPHFNAHFDGAALEVFSAVHIGLAVDTERGLLVPVLRDVAGQGLTALAQARSALVARTLSGAVTPAELSGGTFTLTNLGALGIDAFTPVLNPPQVAILGVGRIRPVALPVNGVLAARQAMVLSLTFDHRAVDGAPAARFLGDIAALIERPDRIWL
jgi:pyruvate dehydrogenase E2 component (dihydrolipoamide acetyltransferase)